MAMKRHRIGSALLAMILGLGLLAGCSSSGSTADSEDMAAAEEDTGSVYWLTIMSSDLFQEAADEYEAMTGVPVTIQSVSSADYDEMIEIEMEKGEDAPTIFNLGNRNRVNKWSDYCVNLREADVYKELTTSNYTVYDDDNRVLAIPYCLEVAGMLVNTNLLSQAGYTVEDVYNFDSLKAVADDIHARTDELGFDAFTSSELDWGSSSRITKYLPNVALFYEARDDNWGNTTPSSIKGTYLDNFKQAWDLYTTDCAYDRSTLSISELDSRAQFLNEEAVFYLGGSWGYLRISQDFSEDDLAVIPLYIGVEGEENAGLCMGTEGLWAVNNQASPEDQKASLDFMYWMATSDTGINALVTQLGGIPYKNAESVENKDLYFKYADQYESEGKYNIDWTYSCTPQGDLWRMGLVAALNHYDIGDSWDYVRIAFVDDWTEYYNSEYD